MALIDDIQRLTKIEKELRDVYLNRLIDFLKWTSAIALATFLWIGTNFSKYIGQVVNPIIDKQICINSSILNSSIVNSSITENPGFFTTLNHFLTSVSQIILVISFGSILMSLLIAVVTFYVILGMWDLEWKYIGTMNSVIELFNENRDKDTFSDEEFSKKIEGVKDFHFKYQSIKNVKFMFKLHVFLLIVGILCFYFSILFQ